MNNPATMKTVEKLLAFVTGLQYLIQPSFIQDKTRLRKLLLLSTRIYYIYSGLFFALLAIMNYFGAALDFLFSFILFTVQAAILFYILQIYRRFFSVSPELKDSFTLRFFFSLWLVIFSLLSIEQIIGYPIFSGDIILLIGKGQNHFLNSLITNRIYLSIFFVALGVAGEYLLRKIRRK